MVQHGKVNVKLSDRQLKQLKSAAKGKTGRTLRISLMDMICLMNYYWQQDKKRSSKMHLITICQLIEHFLKLKFLK